MLTEILARATPHAGARGRRTARRSSPNHVYVIPPDTDLVIARRHAAARAAHARRAASTGRSTTSSARWPRTRGTQAIGVILSGTGTDGTLGLAGDQGRGRHHLRPGRHAPSTTSMPRSADRRRLRRLRAAAATRSRAELAPHRPPPLRRAARRDGRAAVAPTRPASTGSSDAAARARPASTSATTSATRSTGASRGAWCCTSSTSLDDYVALPAEQSRRGRRALPGHPDQRHELLPRPGGVRGAQGEGLPGAAPRAARRHDPLRVWVLGLLDRRGGLLARHRLRRVRRGARAGASPIQIFATDLNEAGIEQGARRRLPEEHRARRLARAAAALLRRGRTAATGSPRRSATCASSRGTTCSPTRRSRASTWSAAATC